MLVVIRQVEQDQDFEGGREVGSGEWLRSMLGGESDELVFAGVTTGVW